MEDLLLGNDVEESLRRAAADLEDRLRFRVDEHRLELLGRCHRCA